MLSGEVCDGRADFLPGVVGARRGLHSADPTLMSRKQLLITLPPAICMLFSYVAIPMPSLAVGSLVSLIHRLGAYPRHA